MLNNTFSCTQLVSSLVPQKDSCFVFYLFFLQKDFDIFQVLLFEVFLCVFDNSYLLLLYIENLLKKIFISFFLCFKIYVTYMSILCNSLKITLNAVNKHILYLIFCIRVSFIRVFSIRIIGRNFYIVSNII